MIVRYPPARIRYEGDRPVALISDRVKKAWFGPADLPLGWPTTSARSSRGFWALYPLGSEVVVVHPDGAVIGTPDEVAAEVSGLAAGKDQGTIRQLLTGDGTDRARRRRGAQGRTWSIPAKGYWLSGPYNEHGRPPPNRQAVPDQDRASTAGQIITASQPRRGRTQPPVRELCRARRASPQSPPPSPHQASTSSTCSLPVRSRAAAAPQPCSDTRLRSIDPLWMLPPAVLRDGGGGKPVAGQPAGLEELRTDSVAMFTARAGVWGNTASNGI
jgi:hypothetical protein